MKAGRKRPALRCNPAAFTLIELLVIVVIALLLALVLIPGVNKARDLARRKQCVDNLKIVVLSFRQWTLPSGDRYPMFVETEYGGSLSAVTNGETFRHFQTMSNELNTPKVLVCPADNRQPAADFRDSLANTNLSYFVGVDADETQPQMLLTGDRNLTNGLPSISGNLLILTSNSVANFDHELHRHTGNIGLADGSVQSWNQQSLNRGLMTEYTNRLQLP